MFIKKRAIARQRLDQRMAAFKPESGFTVPPKGWIRAIRDALGMTRGQLGARLGVKPQSIADLEQSEALGTIRLESLRRVAEALERLAHGAPEAGGGARHRRHRRRPGGP